MAATIRAAIKLDGEAQFRQAVAGINSDLKTLNAESKLVSETFKGEANSLEALQAKHKALSNTLDASKRKEEEIAKALTHAQQTRDKVANGLEKLHSEYDKEKQKLDQMKSSGKASEAEMKAQEKTVKQYADAIKQGEKNLTTAENRIKRWTSQQTNAKLQTAQTNNALKENARYMQEAEKATDHCAKSIDEFGNKQKSAQNSTKSTQEAMDALAQVMVSAGIANGAKEVAEALLECDEAASRFGETTAKVMTIADKSVISSGQMARSLMDLSAETGQSVNDLGEATYQAISASVDTADAVDFVRQSTKLSIGGFTNQAAAVDTLTTVINAYGKSASDAGHISDVLIQTQNKGKTTVDQLGQSLGQVIPSAASANVSFENLSAAMAITTKNGLDTALSSTALRSMMTELSNASSNVSKVLVNETGKSFAQLMASGMSLGDVMSILTSSVNGNMDSFKGLWGNVRAGNAAFILAKEGGDGFNQMLSTMQNSTGMANEAFMTMTNTAEYADQRFKNSIDNFKIAVGAQLEASLEELRSKGADAFEWATDFVSKYPAVVSAVAGVTTAVGTMAAGITALAAATKILPLLVEGFTGLMAANPAGLAIVGVTAAIAGLTVATGALAGKQDEASIKMQGLVDEANKSNDSIQKNIESRQQSANSIETEYGAYGQMIERLKELNSIQDKSAAQKGEMSSLVSQLSGVIPGLASSYDAASGSIKMTNAELDQFAQKAEASAKAAAAQESIKQIYQDIYQAQVNEKTATKQLALAQENLAKAREKGQNGGLGVTWAKEQEAVDNAKKNVEKYKDTQKTLNSELETARGILGDNADAMSGAGDAAGSMGDSISAAGDEVTTAAAQMQQSISDAVSSMTDSFDKFNGGTEYSADDLQNNLQSQIDGMNQWAADMQTLSTKAGDGMTQGLYNKLVEMGPQAANAIHTMATMSDSELSSFLSKMSKTSGDLPTEIAQQVQAGSDALGQAGKDAGSKVGKGVEEGVKSGKKGVKNAADEVGKAGKVTSKNSKGNRDAGAKDSKAYGSGVKSGKSSAKKSADEVSKSGKVKSKNAGSNKSAGSKDAKAYANGVKSGKSSVKKNADEISRSGKIKSKNSGANKKAGEKDAKSYGQGIKGQKKNVEKEANNITKVKVKTQPAKKAGQDVGKAAAQGIKSKKSEINAAAKSLMSGAPARIRSGRGAFRAAGSYCGQGVAAGLRAALPAVTAAANAIVAQAVRAARAKAKVKSPSRVFRDEVGKYMGLGIAKGLDASAHSVRASSANLMDESLRAAQKEGGIHSPSKVWMDKVGKQMAGGLAMGIKAGGKNAKKSATTLASMVQKAATKWLQKQGKKNSAFASSEYQQYFYQRLLKDAKKKGGKYYKSIKKYVNDQQGKLADAQVNAIKGSIAAVGSANDAAINAQINAWNTQINNARKYGSKYANEFSKQAQEQIQALRDLQAERLETSVSSSPLDAYRTYYGVSEKAEMQYWDIIRRNGRYSAEQRLEADKAYYEARKNYLDKQTEAYQTYADKEKEINDGLTENIKSAQESLRDSVQSSTESIMNSYDLFDTFLSESKNGEELLQNMRMQSWGYKEWQKDLDTLRAKFAANNLNSTLLDAIIKKGPQAEAEVRALNQLDTSQLIEYSDLYGEKMKVAQEEADKQNEELKRSTNQKIQEFKDQANRDLTEAKNNLNATLNSLEEPMTTALQTLAENAWQWGAGAIDAYCTSMGRAAADPDNWASVYNAMTTAGTIAGQQYNAAMQATINNTPAPALKPVKAEKKKKKKKKKKITLKAGKSTFATVKAHDTGGYITEVYDLGQDYGPDDGMASVKLGEMVLPKNFSQDIVPKFTASVEKIQSLIDNAIPNANAFNKLVAPSYVAPQIIQRGDAGTELLTQMLGLLQRYLPQTGNKQIVLDTGVVAGELTDPISKNLATEFRRRR